MLYMIALVIRGDGDIFTIFAALVFSHRSNIAQLMRDEMPNDTTYASDVGLFAKRYPRWTILVLVLLFKLVGLEIVDHGSCCGLTGAYRVCSEYQR
jgi:hypothetical protein